MDLGEEEPAASGVKRLLSADAALDRPPERLYGQNFIVAIQGSTAKYQPNQIASFSRRVERSHKATTNATPVWSVSTLNVSRRGISD